MPPTQFTAAQWRPLINKLAPQVWGKGFTIAGISIEDWTQAQVQAESGGNPNAVSPVGAQGLLQLMPFTAKELGVTSPFDPEQNLRAGMLYLKQQYDHFPEIPGDLDRLMFSYASYNCGRGFLNTALQIAESDRINEHWRWSVLAWYLMHRECTVAMRSPSYRDVWRYTAGICGTVTKLVPSAELTNLLGAPFNPTEET